ncbi:MAG: PPC domain-containing protein, partial [Burkholderiaceae bacterium]|nr:PPC domain-containing protein [Burkholderiaceae bacterium]
VVPVQGDITVESDEAFSLVISLPSPPLTGASITTGSASTVIRNDDFPDDYAASTATAGAVAIGSSVSGAIENEADSDWFRVTLAAGTEYQFDLAGTAGGGLADPLLRLRDANGIELIFNDNLGAGSSASQIIYTPAASGSYYLDAQSSNRSASLTGAYTLSTRLTPQPIDDFTGSNGSPGTAPGVLGVGRDRALTGSIERAIDQDWFRIALQGGSIYQFEALPGSTDALANPALELIDPTGTRLLLRDNDRGEGLGARVPYYIATSGDYFLKVTSASGALGSYSVRALTAIEADPDAAGGVGTTRVLAGDEWQLGRITSAQDVDYYRVDLSAGAAYQFRARSLDLPDPVLRVRGPDGKVVATNDDESSGSNDALVVYSPTVSGAYYLDVGSFFGGSSGTYLVSAAPEPRGVYTNTYSFSATGVSEVEGSDGNRMIAVSVQRAGTAVGTTSALIEIVHDQTDAADFDLGLSGLDPSLGAIPVVFGPGITSTVFQVAVKGDTLAEGDERFSLRLVAPPGNATGAISTVPGLIRDDDSGGGAGPGGGAGDGSGGDGGGGDGGDPGPGGGAGNGAGDGAGSSDVAPVYRFAKVSNGAYFFTGNAAERDQIQVSFPDFRAEGVAFQRYADASAGTPVYRFANLDNGGYFYTGSAAERDATIANYPNMRFEGSTFSVADPGTSGALPVFRLANLNNGAYLYTTSAQERAAAVGLGFWRDEGVSFHAPGTVIVKSSDDFAASSTSTGRLVPGGSASGQIESAGDADWFAASLVAGTRYVATLSPASANGLADPLLGVWRSNTDFVIADDNSGGNGAARLDFTPSVGGTYYFAALGAANSTGAYALSLTASSVPVTDDYPQSGQTTGRVVTGQSAGGRLEVAGDHDWLLTSLDPGVYTFTIQGEAGGVVPVAALRNAQGTVMAQVGNGGGTSSVSLNYTAPTAGAYFVDVSALANQTGGYSIVATRTSEPQPSLARGLIGFATPLPEKLLEGGEAVGETVGYTIVRSGPLDAGATVNLQIVPIGLLSPASDLDLAASGFGATLSRTLSFAPGESRQVLTLVARGDAIAEATESFELRLSAPSSNLGLGVAAVTAQLIDDDRVTNPTDTQGAYQPGEFDLTG